MDAYVLQQFSYDEVAKKVALSAGIGLVVGLEREWAQKETGVRTFAIVSLLGMITSLLTPMFVVGALVGVLLMVVFLNVHSLLKDRSLELTTSIALMGVFFLGVLVGTDHGFAAATSAIIMMILLASKMELERFAGALKPEEIRSAVLLGLISVVIFPLLPDRFIDPWNLVNPHEAWVIVIVIAGVGFLNYALLRLYGNRGLYYAAILGGLVNSTAAVAELSSMFDARGDDDSGRGVAILMLTNVAMFLRNVVLLAIFASAAVATAAPPLVVMAVFACTIAYLRIGPSETPVRSLKLASPVSFTRIIKFSVVLLALSIVGTLAQRAFGSLGFVAVAIMGGLVSSASTTATAAALVKAGVISPQMAGIATVLTSMSSAIVNMPLVYQQTKQFHLTRRLAIVSLVTVGSGVAVLMLLQWMEPSLKLQLPQ